MIVEIYLEEAKKKTDSNTFAALVDKVHLYQEAGLSEEEIIKKLPGLNELKVNEINPFKVNVKLELATCNKISFVRSSNTKLDYEISNESVRNELYVNLTEDQITIKEKKRFITKKDNKYDLVIYLPKNYLIDNLNINSVYADLYIDNININEASINVVSGDTSIKASDIIALKVNSVSGDVVLENDTVKKTNIHTVSGDLSIKNIKVDESISMKSVSGDLKIYGNYDMGKFKLNTLSGTISYEK